VGGSIAPNILILSIRWKLSGQVHAPVVCFTPGETAPKYPVGRRLCGPQNRSGDGGKVKKFLLCPCWKLNKGHPACNNTDFIRTKN